MRGYEFAVSKAEVLYKENERGQLLEPMEIAFIDVPEEFSGSVIQKLSERKGELQGMSLASDGSTRLEFSIPARGLIGYRGEFMTATKGNGIMNTVFDEYGPYKGDIQYRKQGSLIAFESGESVTYGLFSAQDRGTLFIGPGEKVYAGMVIGQNGKAEDIELNVCKTKHLTNTRSSSADEALKLTPPRVLSLEQALEFIDKDELLEVTPDSLRIRKKYWTQGCVNVLPSKNIAQQKPHVSDSFIRNMGLFYAAGSLSSVTSWSSSESAPPAVASLPG